MLKTEAVAKAFGGNQVLTDISLEVAGGEIVGLLGPNGSGKTTLLNLMSGFLPVSSGRIWFGGAEVTGQAPHRISQAGMRRTFQQARMPARMSCAEVLLTAIPQPVGSRVFALFARPRRVAAEERAARRAVAQMLELLHLAPVADQPAAALSGGQQKLIALGAAILGGAKLLLLDEPTAGVAPSLRRDLADTLRGFREDGLTIVVVEHDMGFISRLCDRCVVMDRGVLIANCRPDELLHHEEVVSAYLGTKAAAQPGAATGRAGHVH